MSKVIEIDELSKFLQQDFLDYAGEVNEIVESECKEMANKLKTELSNDSSIPQSTSRQKHYFNYVIRNFIPIRNKSTHLFGFNLKSQRLLVKLIVALEFSLSSNSIKSQ